MEQPDDAPGDLFTHRGRPFLRLSLPEPGRPPFVVARTIADRYRVDGLFHASHATLLLRATDLRTHHAVLVKALDAGALFVPPDHPEPVAAWTEEVRRLRHHLQAERRLLVRLRDAGIVGVPHPNDYAYDHNPALVGRGLPEALVDAEPFLVLEHRAGVSLETVLERSFPQGMEERPALGLIRPVVEALAVLHEPWRLGSGHTWHCVYQDLKPANILVEPSGRPVLLDFGGCQVVVDGVPVLEGACTAGYAAPECAGPAARVLLPCADAFGIGATLHHMLTGIDPRDRLARRRGAPGGHLDARDLPRRVSSGVRDLLGRLLAPRPSDRLADARRVAEAIDACLGDGRSVAAP